MVNDYGDGDVWHVVGIIELDGDGSILRETRYHAQPLPAPAWRAELTQPQSRLSRRLRIALRHVSSSTSTNAGSCRW